MVFFDGTAALGIDLIQGGGHEIGHHGYLHEKPNHLTRQEEQDCLGRAIVSIVSATGKQPTGYSARRDLGACAQMRCWRVEPRVDRLPFWDAPMKNVICGKGAVRGD